MPIPDEAKITLDFTGCDTVELSDIWSKDFTIAIPRSELLKLGENRGLKEHVLAVLDTQFPPKYSVDEMVELTLPSSTGKIVKTLCRMNACLCQERRYVSFTFRIKDEEKAKKLPKNPATQPPPLSGHHDFNSLIQSETVADLLRYRAMPPTPEMAPMFGRPGAQGLIIFSGGTGSKKSTQAIALALDHIGRIVAGPGPWESPPRPGLLERPPHLVSFEDPIEGWPQEGMVKTDLNPETAAKFGFNLTPRQRGKDVASLKGAIQDAKRQTPACFYVGELRNETEWKDVLEFAGSGHLVIVTTHAGSLQECVSRVLSGSKAKTPAMRGDAARNILACVHLIYKKNKLLPAVWFGTAEAVHALVSDGISSVVPNGTFCLNREQVVNSIPAGPREDQRESFRAAARDLDLSDF